jgi:hypothetical protein
VLRSLALDSLHGAVPSPLARPRRPRRQLETAYAGILARYDEFFGGDSRADITVSLALLILTTGRRSQNGPTARRTSTSEDPRKDRMAGEY